MRGRRVRGRVGEGQEGKWGREGAGGEGRARKG